MLRVSIHLSLLFLGLAGLFNVAASTSLDGGAEKRPGEHPVDDAASLDPLDGVFEGIKTSQSKSLLKNMLDDGTADDKFNFLQKVKESFFVKYYLDNKGNKDKKEFADLEKKETVVTPHPTHTTAEMVHSETTPLPLVRSLPVGTVSTASSAYTALTTLAAFTPSSALIAYTTLTASTTSMVLTVSTELTRPVITGSPVFSTAVIKHETVIPVSWKSSLSPDCKFQTSNGTPPQNFISDVLGNWQNTRKGFPNRAVTPDDTIKKVFASEIRKQFPKEILPGLGLSEYVGILFSNENDKMSLDETLSVFSQMYTDVLGKLGLETTKFEPNSSDQIMADTKSNRLWAKIGETTVSPFLEETFSKSCLENENSLPSADAAMKLMLELPLDVTNGLVRRSDDMPSNFPFLFDDQMDSAKLFGKITAFVNSLSPDVMDEVVADYAKNKPFVEHIEYEDLEMLARKDLIEYLTMLSLAPTDDLANYFTDSIKDGLYFTFSLSSVDDSIGSIPGLRELIDRIMQLPNKYLKLLVKKASIIIKKTFKLFAKVDFLKNKVDLIKNKLSKPLKMLTTLPFESTYDMYSLNKKALEKSDIANLTTKEQSEKNLKSFLGLEDYNFSYDAIIAFLTEFAQLSNDAALAVFEDLSVRLNPFSGISKKMYEKEQRVTKRIDDLYEKYDITNTSKRLSNKLLSMVGLDESSFNVTTTPAPPSFFEKFNTELKRFPDNLLLSFRNPLSWGKDATKFPFDKTELNVPDGSLSAKELLQVFYNFLNESKELDEKQKIQLVKMLSSKMKPHEKQSQPKQFSSHLYDLGYWFGNTTNDVVGELTNWWSGNQGSQSKDKSTSSWMEGGKQNKFNFGTKTNVFSKYDPATPTEDVKSTSFVDKISQLEKKKRLFMEENGFTNLSQKGKEEVHKAVKSTSSLVSWNKPADAKDSLNVQKSDFGSSKYAPVVGNGINAPDLQSKLRSKYVKSNQETFERNDKSDIVGPEFVEEMQNGEVKDLIARYKMLKFPVTLVNSVKKHLLSTLKESEKTNLDGDGKKELSTWDKLVTKFGYTLPEIYDVEPRTLRVRRATPKDLTHYSTEATVQLEQFLADPNAKDLALHYLTKEGEQDVPGDSLVAILVKFFNIR